MPPDQSTLTLAAIAVAGVTPIVVSVGSLLVQERRIRHEHDSEAARLKREGEAADSDRLRALVDEAHAAAQRGMTYLESVGSRRPPLRKRQTDRHAEAVRSAAWRMALHLGEGHELVSAYSAVTQAFDHWNDVASGTVRAA